MTEPEPQELVLVVGSPAAGGACVARSDEGQVVFVRHALPGERVRAVVTARTTTFLRADAVEVLTPSPDRVAAPCPYAGPGRCGGCDWQHVALPRQRLLKGELVAEQLRRLAGVDVVPIVEQVPGAPDGLGWRTRMQLAVDGDGRPALRKHRSHDLELIDRCLIASPDVEAVEAERLTWPGAAAVHIAGAERQRLVSVASVRRGRAVLPDLDEAVGVTIDGRAVRTPHGLVHTVLGRRFEVAAESFWQVHVGAAEALAHAVLDGLEPREGDRVVDLYAGAGLFAALLGERVGAGGSVLAVESSARATADAARNTADLPHVKVRTAEVDRALVGALPAVDLVVLDPPRTGAGIAITRALARMRPRRLAYVACDPASFARDLKVLLDAGWSLGPLRAFDLFPMTEHVELVAVLSPPGQDPRG